MAPRTSIICAVWHKDPDRHELVRQHRANLAAQTTDVSAIYVYDNSDTPPDDLDATVAVSSEPLTIYQAWNVAVSLAETDYVMNLNLDDRLRPDAAEQMQTLADANRAGLVGGDWRICYTQEDTDRCLSQGWAVFPDSSEGLAIVPAMQHPFDPAWPPIAEEIRLGSGTGERGTFGPATMWRRDLHERFPYPWQFGDGSPIQTVGDVAWWTAVQRMAPTLRLPFIVGNYHSHPETQAEFRGPDEVDKLNRLGVAYTWYPHDNIEVI